MLIVPIYIECRDQESVEDAVDLLRSNGYPCFADAPCTDGQMDLCEFEKAKEEGETIPVLRPITTPLVRLRSPEEWEAAYQRGELGHE